MFKRTNRVFWLIIMAFTAVVLAASEIPHMINYQGVITESDGNAFSGTCSIDFRLYDSPENSNLLWSETQSVSVQEGTFNVLLGSLKTIPVSVFSSSDVYFTMKIDNDDEMEPRQRIVSVGYAFHAATADSLKSIQTEHILTEINHLVPKDGSIQIKAGHNISIDSDEDSSQITISATGNGSGSGSWLLNGNSGTSPGTEYIGTNDNEALEIKVYGERAGRIEPHAISPNIIFGSENNTIESEEEVYGATISGGGGTNINSRNVITGGSFGTIGGGAFNRADNASVVAGGIFNKAYGQESFIGGGNSNKTYGYGTVVPGGQSNIARQDYSFAAGYKARANHYGSFVWGCYPNPDSAYSTDIAQFIIYALGGVGIGTNDPDEMLSVNGTVESIDGGFKFPDGTTQTTASDAGSYWHIQGNANTWPENHFIGTTNNQPLELRANNLRAIRIEPSDEGPNIIAGYHDNFVSVGIKGATISGGGFLYNENAISANYGTICGGYGNWVREKGATIGGGNLNMASGFGSVVCGGQNNIASGRLSTVAGGSENVARKSTSFAAGYNARANHWGAFVFSDVSSNDSTYSTADNQFIIRAAGGVGINTTDPKGALDVNGAIYQRGTSLHADYVFSSDYNLESIEDHAQRMWEEGHLPAVPKSKMTDDGQQEVEVGSYRKGMLEELEKAHIYIEQLNVRIIKLEKIIDSIVPYE